MPKWLEVGALDEIPRLGARVIETAEGDIALFRTRGDAVFAVQDQCPHRQGPLSQGLVHGNIVTCPLHNWEIDLESGKALPPDEGCTNVYATRIEDGMVMIRLSGS